MIFKKLSELEVLSDDELQENGIVMDGLKHPDEIFVPIAGWSQYYIGSYGSLLSQKHNPWLILNPNINPSGYLTYTLSQNNVKQCLSAAHLVCFAFYDIQYPKSLWPYIHAHHRDGDIKNNYFKNIEPLLNNHHMFSHRSLELLLFRGKGLESNNTNYKNVEDALACEVGVTLPELMDAIINAQTMQPYADSGDNFAYKMVTLNDVTVFVRLRDDDWQQAMQQATADDTDDTDNGDDSNVTL